MQEPFAKRRCLLPIAVPRVRPRAIAKPRPPGGWVDVDADPEAEAQYLQELRQERYTARLWEWHSAATAAEERCFRLSLAGLCFPVFTAADPIAVLLGHPRTIEQWESWSDLSSLSREERNRRLHEWEHRTGTWYSPPSWWDPSSS